MNAGPDCANEQRSIYPVEIFEVASWSCLQDWNLRFVLVLCSAAA